MAQVRSRRWVRRGAIGGLLVVLAGLLWLLWLRSQAVTALDGGEDPPAEVTRPIGVAAYPSQVLGRVMLEDMSVGTGDPGRVGEDSGPSLRAPPAGTCTARAWHEARLLAEAACADDGSFALRLPGTALAGGPVQVSVEMLVPGHLRGFLPAPVVPGADVQLPTVALGPAVRLSGEVLDRQGRAVADVEVAALPVPSLGEPEPWRVTSAADGSFVLDTLPEGPVRLRATRSGHALTITDAFAPEAGVVIVLDELLGLEGAVIGDPAIVARAQVRLEGSSLWPPLLERVEPTGEFHFSDLVDGVYGLVATVEAATPGAQEYASIPLENLGPGTEVGLALALAYRIPVKVISPDGSPVSGARVTVGYASIGLLQQVGQTGPEGQVAIGPIVPGPYVVSADADGYLPSETLSVDLGATPLPVQTLTLLRPGRIAGAVIDEDGQPVADASIVVDGENLYSVGESSARAGTFTALVRGGSLGVTTGAVPPIPLLGGIGAGTEDAGFSAHSDDAGQFALNLLMPGTYRLRAVHGRHAASAVAVVTLTPGQTRDGVVLTLGRGVHLTGRVFDGNRRPLAGVRVELEDGSEVLTDMHGVFDAGYRRGRERLVLRRAGLIPEVVEVELGRADVEVERLMQPAEGVLGGRVRDGNDQPIAGVRVTLTPADGLTATQLLWTDERGVFEFSDLAPGTGTVELDHPDFAPEQSRVRVPRGVGKSVELRLFAGWALALGVRARGTGAPIAGARIEVDDRLWSTDERGTAEVRRLAGPRVRVVVRAGGWVAHSEVVDRPEEGAASLLFELDEAAGMEGEVMDERGEPVGGAQIVVRTGDGEAVLAEAWTTADGHWSVPDLPEGDVLVEAIPPPALAQILAPVTVESDVRRGHVTREVDLRFDRL